MPNDIPPIVLELFKLLPPIGTEFPLIDRLRWLNAAEAIFKMIFKDDPIAKVVFEAQDKQTSGSVT
jgi:hypothetical protein